MVLQNGLILIDRALIGPDGQLSTHKDGFLYDIIANEEGTYSVASVDFAVTLLGNMVEDPVEKIMAKALEKIEVPRGVLAGQPSRDEIASARTSLEAHLEVLGSWGSPHDVLDQLGDNRDFNDSVIRVLEGIKLSWILNRRSLENYIWSLTDDDPERKDIVEELKRIINRMMG